MTIEAVSCRSSLTIGAVWCTSNRAHFGLNSASVVDNGIKMKMSFKISSAVERDIGVDRVVVLLVYVLFAIEWLTDPVCCFSMLQPSLKWRQQRKGK